MNCGRRFVTLYRRQGSRPSSWKRNAKKQNGCLGEALQIAAKSKGEKERYKHLNAEFQRIARRDKKAFLRDQCKEIEEYNRIGKTRDLFKKIRDTRGTFHAKMGSIKDRDGMDLQKQKILRRGGKNTQKNCTKKVLDDLDNHDGVITDLEPDILECEIKWAFGRKTHYEQS